MNRLKEIKDRLNLRIKAETPPVPVDVRIKAHSDFDEHAVDDVQYLLSKLEIAIEGLETAYDYIKQTDREGHKMQLLKTLEQIREGDFAVMPPTRPNPLSKARPNK